MKTDRNWVMTTLGSFLATVLGIMLTFGVSKLADRQNSREMQKQCVYNALSDINNVMTDLKVDSLYCSGWYPILPNYIERRARNEKVPVDTVAALFLNGFQVPTILVTRYEPVGKAILESIPPTDAYDMQLHRFISLAYEAEANAIAFEDEYYKFYDKVMDINRELDASTKNYSLEEIADIYLGDETIHRFAGILKYVCENDMLNYYSRVLQFHKQRILQYSGISEDEYQEFIDQLNQKPEN